MTASDRSFDQSHGAPHGGATSLHATKLQLALTTYSLVLFGLLWVGLLAAIAFGDGWLDSLWSWLRDLPLLVEIIVWVACLPLVVGLAVWESSWSDAARIGVFAVLALWSVIAFASLRFVGGDD